MQNTYTVYKHTNQINNKVYIGITKQNINNRWGHQGKGYINCTAFYRAIQKYGWDHFDHEILATELTKEEACKQEKELIQQYQSNNPEYGYNISPGGATGPTDFTKMTEWANKNKKFGIDNKNSKRVKCKETGDIFGSLQEAERWSGAGHGKITMYCQGQRNHAGTHPITGEPLTWELVDQDTPVSIICNERTRPVKSIKPIYCITTNTVYVSGADAAKAVGLKSASGILRCCYGERKTAGGLEWKFFEGE